MLYALFAPQSPDKSGRAGQCCTDYESFSGQAAFVNSFVRKLPTEEKKPFTLS